MENFLIDGTTFVIDGVDGAGKTTVIKCLKEKLPKSDFEDRGELSALTLKDVEEWPEKLSLDRRVYVILEADIETLNLRISKRGEPRDDTWETPRKLFYYRYLFRRLAATYGLLLIDTTNMTIDQVVNKAMDYMMDVITLMSAEQKGTRLIPSEANLGVPIFTKEALEKLPIIAQGESKIVRRFENWEVITYKPTVYSHKQQRAGVIDGSARERMIMTRDILELLAMHMIEHHYWYVGEDYILATPLRPTLDIPPIEVIVKGFFVGTDKYRYYNMEKQVTRQGLPATLKLPGYAGEAPKYATPLVRFDYRNPNHHPETGEPIGDHAMCDDLAAYFIDTTEAKDLALRVFNCLQHHVSRMEPPIMMEDVCLMITGTHLPS